MASSKFSFTAAASNFSPFWNVTPSRSVICQLSKVSLAIQPVASQGLAPLSGPTVASGSSTDEPTRLPYWAHSLLWGFHPAVSAATAITRLPPSTGVPSEVGVLASLDAVPAAFDPQAPASRARATAAAIAVRSPLPRDAFVVPDADPLISPP